MVYHWVYHSRCTLMTACDELFLRPWWLANVNVLHETPFPGATNPLGAMIPRASWTQTLSAIQYWKYGVAAACVDFAAQLADRWRISMDQCIMQEISALLLIRGLRFKGLLFTLFGFKWTLQPKVPKLKKNNNMSGKRSAAFLVWWMLVVDYSEFTSIW